MTTMPSSLLLDSNVWIDLFASERPGRKATAELVGWAIENEVSLLYAAISLKDVFYILEEREKRMIRAGGGEVTPSVAAAVNEYAWACLRAIDEVAVCVPIDLTDTWVATKLRALHGDFEDNLILAAIERSHADYLITNDEVLLRRTPVAALNVNDALTLFKTG